MSERLITTHEILDKLEDSLSEFETLSIQEFGENYNVDNKLKTDFLDNESKTSSGYDDEEDNDDDNRDIQRQPDIQPVSRSDGRGDKDDQYVITTSGDEDYIDISQIDSISSTKDNTPKPSYRREFLASRFKTLWPLDLYPPSEEIKIAKELSFTKRSLYENHTEVIKTFLNDSKIHENNIHLVYKMLVEMEDITCMSEYPPLVQKNVMLMPSNVKREYWISLQNCPNIDEIVTPFIDEVVLVPILSSAMVKHFKYATDILLPHEHENNFTCSSLRRRIATVQQISKERAYFRFSVDEHLSSAEDALLHEKRYDIIFRPTRYPLRYQQEALDSLALSSEIRKYLFPTENTYRNMIFQPQHDLELLNTTMLTNPEQLAAVRYVLEGPNCNAPFIIFGPPGTGKTTTIVESILQLRLRYPRSRILVTAGSNSACDTIALRICKYFKSNSRLKQLDSLNETSLIRIFSKSIVDKGIQNIDRDLLKQSNCVSGHHFYPSVEQIRRYGIIVATLCTVGKLVTGDIGNFDFFTHVFMDEAGASTEPESLVGIMGIKTNSNCRLILSGDHKQLGPILKSEHAARLGLEKSLMERLLCGNCYATDSNGNYDRTLQARLKRNYRSHPEIVRLFNHLYYNNELISVANAENVNLAANWCKLPNAKFPIIFQAVHGVTEKDNVSPSSCNNLEISVLMWFLKRLLKDGINGVAVEQTDIGIITPYKLQSKRIQARLNASGWHQVETGSVETFQGREKQIIIVSLVKSFASLGFIRNPKRLNVILSRPKSLLILIGNPLTLKRNKELNFIMEECKKYNTFLRKRKTRKHKRR